MARAYLRLFEVQEIFFDRVVAIDMSWITLVSFGRLPLLFFYCSSAKPCNITSVAFSLIIMVGSTGKPSLGQPLVILVSLVQDVLTTRHLRE
jgi:hypothetical protein